MWLLEINTNPYLGCVNEYITGLMPKMIDEVLSLTLDKVYPPSNEINIDNLFTVLNLSDRRPFNEGIYPVASL